MSSIPIVQGVPVNYQQAPSGKANYSSSNDFSFQEASAGGYTAAAVASDQLAELRQNPPRQYQDAIWAIAFWVHVVAIMVFIGMGVQSAGGGGGRVSSYSGVLFMVGITGLTSVGLSCAALAFMMNHAESLVQTSLIFSVLTSLLVGIVGFLAGNLLMGILGLVSFAVGICYAKMVWSRIPYAAANLRTAVSAVQQNMGLTAVALGFTAIAFAWTILWFLGLGNSMTSTTSLVLVFILVRVDSYYVFRLQTGLSRCDFCLVSHF
jgi:hypothetical protein